jgi:hypothetical protein
LSIFNSGVCRYTELDSKLCNKFNRISVLLFLCFPSTFNPSFLLIHRNHTHNIYSISIGFQYYYFCVFTVFSTPVFADTPELVSQYLINFNRISVLLFLCFPSTFNPSFLLIHLNHTHNIYSISIGFQYYYFCVFTVFTTPVFADTPELVSQYLLNFNRISVLLFLCFHSIFNRNFR